LPSPPKSSKKWQQNGLRLPELDLYWTASAAEWFEDELEERGGGTKKGEVGEKLATWT